MRLRVQVTIVNTGPAALDVERLSGASNGVTLSITDKQRWIDPGTSVVADAVVIADCVAGLPLGELEATLSVVTADDTARQSPVFSYLVGALRRLCTASLATGNPVNWT